MDFIFCHQGSQRFNLPSIPAEEGLILRSQQKFHSKLRISPPLAGCPEIAGQGAHMSRAPFG